MKEKLNIAELLKDCPKGMELDCTICNNLKFVRLDISSNFPIVVRNNGYEFSLTKYGQVHNVENAKCVIFPKGKTTWEGFVPPCKFKDGDIVYFMNKYGDEYISIVKNIEDNYINTYIYSDAGTNTWLIWFLESAFHIDNIRGQRLATEEEKVKFFNKIKKLGYKWNSETKTWEKLITPNKFDIAALKPFDKVLCRMDNDDIWGISLFESYAPINPYPFFCIQDCFS